MIEYRYLGDRITDVSLKGQTCTAVRRGDKCIRGANGSMLVEFINPRVRVVVIGRLLRRI